MTELSSPELLNIQKVSNEDILEAKGISDYFDKIDPELLEKRVIMGKHKKKPNFTIG